MNPVPAFAIHLRSFPPVDRRDSRGLEHWQPWQASANDNRRIFSPDWQCGHCNNWFENDEPGDDMPNQMRLNGETICRDCAFDLEDMAMQIEWDAGQ